MEESLAKKLFRVAAPIAAQSLIAASLSLVDNLMVGHLGETELAAVGLSTQVGMIFWMALFGFTGGTITYMAQFFGKGDIESIRRVLGIAVATCFLIGLGFFLVCFFAPEAVLRVFTDIPEVIDMGRPFVRWSAFIFLTWSVTVPLSAGLKATQQTDIPMKVSIVVFSLNTVLCILLVNGFLGFPKMGIMGAALATVSSRCVELALYLIVIFARRNLLAGPPREYFGWTRELVGRVFANALPTMGNEVIWAAGSSMYNAAYGRMGVTEFAAVQAGNTIFNIFSLVCFSIGDAMLILCGEKLGRGETEEAYEMARRILKIAVILGLVMGGALIAASRVFVKLFNFTELGEHYAALILLVYGATLFVKIHNAVIITGALRSGGDTRAGLFIDTGTVWCIGVPLAFLGALALGIPIWAVVLMVQTEEVVKIFFTRWRFRKKIWVRDLVDNL
ncbi:MAG: MATE family efflux transporter [Clostridiales Family XIII bacterium]|nr:MATE family efflux transporter [Clostridiales Family XIII bacterium]